MHIAFVIPYFYPALGYGGAPRLAYEMARALTRRGHQLTILTTDAGGAGRISANDIQEAQHSGVDGMQVHYYRNLSNGLAHRHRIFFPLAVFQDIRHRLSEAEIIHVHDFRSFLSVAAHRAARSQRTPYVLSPHGSLPPMGKATAKAVFDFLWGKAILRDAAAVCVVSPLEAKDAASAGVDLSRIHPLPAAIDPNQYTGLSCRGAFASRWGIQNRRIVLFLGRLHWIKGADILIEAMSRIHGLADVHLVIAGMDDGAGQQLRSLLKLKRLEQSVTFTGFLDGTEKANALRDSSVVVLPSRREGFPITVLEALATQTPVILTSACDLGTWIHAQPGLISFQSEDVEDLAQKLTGVLCAPPDPKAMAETRNFVLKEFSSDAIAARAEVLYRSLL